MKKVLDRIRTDKVLQYIIIIAFGILISIPLSWLNINVTDDGYIHLLRLIGIDNALEYSSFPFLVQPFFCNNWGYSMVAFYPIIVSYIPYFLGLISGTFLNGILIFASFTIILSGIFMYSFVLEVTNKKKVALISAIVYMILPYRLEDIYNRFAIGEFTAFVFIPIVFQGLYSLIKKDGKKHYYIAIGGIGLILSHTISTIYTVIFCIIYILLNIKQFFKKEIIIKCVINGVFILLVTAIFWVPMMEYELSADYAIFEPTIMATTQSRVYDRAISLIQFLKDIEEDTGVSFVIGIPVITMVLIGVFVYKNLSEKLKDFYLTFLIFGIISLIMCTKLFPWLIMPSFLCTIQFPWRMLGFALFFMTPLCGINVCYLISCIKKANTRYALYILVILIIALFTIKELNTYTVNNEEEESGSSYEASIIENPIISYFSVNRDYMPYKAIIQQNDYLKTRTDEVYVISGSASIENEYKEALYLEFELNNVEAGTELELPYLYYPGYEVTLIIDGMEENIETTESEYGFLKITIPDEYNELKVVVQYTGTILEKSAYILSGISLIGFICYVIYYKKKNKGETHERKIEGKD